MIQATFLTEEQIWGDRALSVLKEYGVAAAPTDLAVILGAVLGGSAKDKEGHLSGAFWSASRNGYGIVRCAYADGDEYGIDTEDRDISARHNTANIHKPPQTKN